MKSQNKQNNKKLEKLNSDLVFLNSHPAFGMIEFIKHSNIYVTSVCKHGFLKPIQGKIEITKDDNRYLEFIDRIPEEDKLILPEENDPILIYVPYKDYFKSDWSIDHHILVCEFSCKRWLKDSNKWHMFSPMQVTGLNFENLISNAASSIKSIFGNFNVMNLTPNWVYEYNKGKNLYINNEDGTSAINNEFIVFGPLELNCIWWKKMEELSPNFIRMYNIPDVDKIDAEIFLEKEKYFEVRN